MAAGLRAFKGVRRRMQLRGTARGVAVYDDFAHHPTAIAETLAGVRSAYPDRRIWAIFEPRSATSCRKVFQDDFARAFAAADRILLPAIFRSTLPDDQRLSTEQLVADLKAAGKDARYIPKVDDIVAHRGERGPRRRPRRRHVERRLRRHPPEAADGARGAGIADLMDARVLPAGDSAWLIELPERIDAGGQRARDPHRARRRSRRPARHRRRRRLSIGHGLRRSAVGRRRRRRGARCARSRRPRRRTTTAPGPLVEVPVCYDGPYGPDLARRRRVRQVLDRRGDRAAPGASSTACSSSASCPGSPTWRRSIRGSRRRAARRRD